MAKFSAQIPHMYISGPHFDHRFTALWRHSLDLGLKWRLEARNSNSWTPTIHCANGSRTEALIVRDVLVSRLYGTVVTSPCRPRSHLLSWLVVIIAISPIDTWAVVTHLSSSVLDWVSHARRGVHCVFASSQEGDQCKCAVGLIWQLGNGVPPSSTCKRG